MTACKKHYLASIHHKQKLQLQDLAQFNIEHRRN